jgi:hypothetical protein
VLHGVRHVIRGHRNFDEFIGSRFLVYAATLEMHLLDTKDRVKELKDKYRIGYCNITSCRQFTENAIISLNEQVADEFF